MHAMDLDDPEAHDSSLPAIIITSAPASASSSSTESPSIIEALEGTECPICMQSLTDKGHKYVVVDTYHPQNTLHQHCLIAGLTTEAKKKHPLSQNQLDASYLMMTQAVQAEVQGLKEFHDKQGKLLDEQRESLSKRQQLLDEREEPLDAREQLLDEREALLKKIMKYPAALCCGGACIGTVVTILAFLFS